MRVTETPALPPIVLFVGESFQEYIEPFEAAGMWVATATDGDVRPTVAELKPDLIVAKGAVDSLGGELSNIPVIAPAATASARTLLMQVAELLRDRPAPAAIRPPATAVVAPVIREASDRACPSCGEMLHWTERAALRGTTYDYYRWCERGCGLYCFEPATGSWVTLA